MDWDNYFHIQILVLFESDFIKIEPLQTDARII